MCAPARSVRGGRPTAAPTATATATLRLLLALALAACCVLGAAGELSLWRVPAGVVPYSNSSGVRLHCAARGSPTPHVNWLAEDGAPLTSLPGLREVLPNGTVWVLPFGGPAYRADVHAATLRCRAASAVGVILSPDVRLHAVMDVWWEVRAVVSGGVRGGGAAVRCAGVGAPHSPHTAVTRWLRDGQEIAPLLAQTGGEYVVGGSRGEVLLILEAGRADGSAFACEVRHALTGHTKTSRAVVLTLNSAVSSAPPRMVAVTEEVTVTEGHDVTLICFAVGSPPPTYSWFREREGRLRAVTASLRVSAGGGWARVSAARREDGGGWPCRAHNALGEQRAQIVLRVKSPLVVTVTPQLQVANSGSTVRFNCSVSGGGPDTRVRWLHDGAPAGSGPELRLHAVTRAHRGMYQCFAERDLDVAQAAAELRLGDTAPELQYTFIEQALHAGPPVALRCSAAGTPPPRFTWLLDGQPIDEHNTPERSISQYVSASGEVVSFLNISSVRVSDGGRYTCRAHNSRGAAEHSTRLNVYGPPSIRNVPPIRVVAGTNTTIFCPYSGFPISEIRWLRNGVDVSETSAGGRAADVSGGAGGAGGSLWLRGPEPADAGIYTCRVTAPSGQYAQKDLQIFVRNPPKISGFSFPTDLVEGSSVQVLCGITSGDKPVYFSWLKDGQQIPPSLQVQEKSLEEFSFLIFSHLTAKHSGEYTCVATNPAAEVNHTARLAVKVGPSWVSEPQPVSALVGAAALAHCAATGYPQPRVTWFKGHGTNVNDFRPLSNMDLQFSVLGNGSLSISPAAHHHEGQYMCRAENGIGRGLSKVISISVNEPAHFEFSSRNMTVKRTAQANLQCDARGDPPIQIQWSHNMKIIDLSTYRVSVSEKRLDSGVSSQLSIARAERADSGVYRCRAENAYGRDELLIYLAVQEFPESPRGLHVISRSARGAVIGWRRGYDGNAAVRVYRLQFRVVGDRHLPDRDDWTLAPTREIPAERVRDRLEVTGEDSEGLLEYGVEGLRPATAYALRLAAVNAIGDSDYSDPVIVQTLEEAPSEPPHNVQVQATAPGELLVKWQSPPQDSWNGELLGYVVWCREAGGPLNGSRALSVSGWGAARAALGALRRRAHYEITVSAFNKVGAGPTSVTTTATTLEGVPEAPPERVRCEPLSAQSLRVWWDPPPPQKRGGILLGYEVLFELVQSLDGILESRRSGGAEVVLGVSRRGGNYSVWARARTAAGPGPPSTPVYCNTHEDIPGPPADIKALANSEESIIVSWLSPLHKNGKIKHYTVYSRPQRTGQHSHLIVAHREAEEEYSVSVGGLREGQQYEFWVTAATASGEGDASAVVAAKPTSKAPAKITSFARHISTPVGSTVRLPCATAGRGVQRTWRRHRPAQPLSADPRFTIEGHYLVILNVDSSLADNYTCAVRSPWGEEEARWGVWARGAPPPPAPTLAHAAPTRIHVQWTPPADDVQSYTIEYSRSHSERWQSTWVPADTRSHSLEYLACGGTYRLRMRARNTVGYSPPSEDLIVSTKGGRSKAAAERDLIWSNMTCLRLNLLTWDSNGCPVGQFSVSVRDIAASMWRSQLATLAPQPLTICDLAPGTWYQLKIIASSDAGTTNGNYYFATLNENGERIPPPASFPPDEENLSEHTTAIMATTGCALVAALLLLATLVWRRSSPSWCVRKGYSQGALSEGDEKCAEKRDNRRNCQQVYTSSPIKSSLGKKEQQEMYEISPYATFSMSEGPRGGSELVCGGTLRTFGRAEPAPLAAAPPRLSAKHRSPTNSEEYTLSRAMTLVARRERSESESSGSPCADCTPPYRLPLTPGKVLPPEEVCRATDSSAESAADSRSVSRGAVAGAAGRPDRDRARRRPRRQHAPTAQRYQQRQERDFTIHV